MNTIRERDLAVFKACKLVVVENGIRIHKGIESRRCTRGTLQGQMQL